MSRWVTLECERAHYVHRGTNVIMCDRLPRGPVTLVVKLASGMEARQGRDAAERLDGEAATARPHAQPLEPKD